MPGLSVFMTEESCHVENNVKQKQLMCEVEENISQRAVATP